MLVQWPVVLISSFLDFPRDVVDHGVEIFLHQGSICCYKKASTTYFRHTMLKTMLHKLHLSFNHIWFLNIYLPQLFKYLNEFINVCQEYARIKYFEVVTFQIIVKRKTGRRKSIVSVCFSSAHKQKHEFSKELEPLSGEFLSVVPDESH